MTTNKRSLVLTVAWTTVVFALIVGSGCPHHEPSAIAAPAKLTHEQTLEWIQKNRAWRQARKTKPLWSRSVDPEEIGKEFQTADHAIERAKEGYWLCVGVAGEPWFQKPEKIE